MLTATHTVAYVSLYHVDGSFKRVAIDDHNLPINRKIEGQVGGFSSEPRPIYSAESWAVPIGGHNPWKL